MRRRQQPSPEEAIAHLLYTACVEIRSMAGRRPSHDPAESIDDIRAIADACHNLPLCLGHTSKRQRRQAANRQLGYLWRSAETKKIEWVRTSLDKIGYDYADLDRLREQTLADLKAREVLPEDYEGESKPR
jgi:hypothetical protein